MDFNKSTVGLDFLIILYMLVKCQDDYKLITMLLIEFKFQIFVFKIILKIWAFRLNSKILSSVTFF